MLQIKKLVFVMAFCLLANTIIIYAQDLPDLGSRSSSILSTHEEQELGKIFFQEVKREEPVINDPLIKQYIKSLGKKLVANSTNPNNHFKFFVVGDSSVNAFTGPDGYIGVNTGLISITKSESELASVLAHEISHANQHHLAYTMERAKSANMSALAILIAAALIGGHSSAAAAAIPATIDEEVQSMLGFSRENEAEADRIGMQDLYKSGFDPMAMPDFFENMQRTTLDYGGQAPAYFRTHPLTSDRIADAENRAKQYPSKKVVSSLDYYLIKARINVITSQAGYSAVDYFKGQLQNNDYENIDAANYGYALALIRANKLAEAESVIMPLIAKDPGEQVYQMALAQAKIEAKQYTDALKILNAALANHPNYYPLVIQYAQVLLFANQPDEARIILQKQVGSYPDDEALYSLLSQAQGQSGYLADAYQSRAKLFEIGGSYELAMVQLEQALQTPNLDSNSMTAIHNQMKVLKEEIAYRKKYSKMI
jgi:beta-barrel assembly-enhancing protease